MLKVKWVKTILSTSLKVSEDYLGVLWQQNSISKTRSSAPKFGKTVFRGREHRATEKHSAAKARLQNFVPARTAVPL